MLWRSQKIRAGLKHWDVMEEPEDKGEDTEGRHGLDEEEQAVDQMGGDD